MLRAGHELNYLSLLQAYANYSHGGLFIDPVARETEFPTDTKNTTHPCPPSSVSALAYYLEPERGASWETLREQVAREAGAEPFSS